MDFVQSTAAIGTIANLVAFGLWKNAIDVLRNRERRLKELELTLSKKDSAHSYEEYAEYNLLLSLLPSSAITLPTTEGQAAAAAMLFLFGSLFWVFSLVGFLIKNLG